MPDLSHHRASASPFILDGIRDRGNAADQQREHQRDDGHAGEVPLAVSFHNTSSGKITGYKWDFENKGRIDSTSPNPSYTYRAVGAYTAKLTVDGPGGSSSATASIQVMTMTVGFDQIAVYNCNTDLDPIHVWTRDITAGEAWVDQGELMEQYDSSGFCPAGRALTVALKDKHTYEVACVDENLINCPGNDPSNVYCRRLYQVVAGKSGGGTLPITSA